MNNQYISTTELREESSKVVKRLMEGMDMTLVHRSKIIGIIKPVSQTAKSVDDLSEFKKILSDIKPAKVIPARKRQIIYRKYLRTRHGKSLS